MSRRTPSMAPAGRRQRLPERTVAFDLRRHRLGDAVPGDPRDRGAQPASGPARTVPCPQPHQRGHQQCQQQPERQSTEHEQRGDREALHGRGGWHLELEVPGQGQHAQPGETGHGGHQGGPLEGIDHVPPPGPLPGPQVGGGDRLVQFVRKRVRMAAGGTADGGTPRVRGAGARDLGEGADGAVGLRLLGRAALGQ
ncbi:hypothetical protein ACFFX0_01200 [Citricoccus parietis]|uniref:Uncharacterized protein n=1 Tax=Citricoccus parietis TaxID=592307 RepID=A0ABV5FUE2_9MICC